MRDWGYVAEWNETDRTLSVISPNLVGYEYGIKLSEGSRPETDNGYYKDGMGRKLKTCISSWVIPTVWKYMI